MLDLFHRGAFAGELGNIFKRRGVSALDLTASDDLAAEAISATEIDLTWTDVALDEEGYKIERSLAGEDDWTEIDDVAADVEEYSDTGLDANTEYDYRIRAYAGALNGEYSNTATATTDFVGPYDGISSAAAFSVRRLYAAYEDDCLRLRRDSDDVESDFGFDSNGDLDTAAITAWLAGANGFVVTWYDQSGNGRNATHATEANQPAYVANVVNGRPILRFDGTADHLLTASGAIAAQGPGTVIAVAKQAGGNAGVDRVCGHNDNAVGWSFGGAPTVMRATSHSVKDYDASSPAWSTSAFKIGSAILDSSQDVTFYANGGTGETVTHNVNATDGTVTYAIGCARGGADFWLGDIAEVVLPSGAVSVGNHNTIGASMDDAYGMTWSTVS